MASHLGEGLADLVPIRRPEIPTDAVGVDVALAWQVAECDENPITRLQVREHLQEKCMQRMCSLEMG